MLLLKYVTLIIFKFGKDILMKKELKRFTFKPVALQYLNDNDGFFMPTYKSLLMNYVKS
jgi:hypothetical protein